MGSFLNGLLQESSSEVKRVRPSQEPIPSWQSPDYVSRLPVSPGQ